ncbi:polyprenyl synthetase family protein [Streptomyces sp. NPDC099088]|uniref:polyprenyl synthetase family protein n=1 Tax=Streptomyces sp. NPDC099088 TaxID=3366101 RepID=UPI00381AD510
MLPVKVDLSLAGPATRAPEILHRSQQIVRPALEKAVADLHPKLAEMAAYSFGWCEVGGSPAMGSAGKGVRQAMALLCAEAAGAPQSAGIASAVTVELVHAFSLIHDDIMDGDHMRRGRPTVWKAYGTGFAVLAGDALIALATQTLADALDIEVRGSQAIRLLARTLADLSRGQADDLLFETRAWSAPDAIRGDDYRTMAENKTGSLLGCAAALGPALAGAPPEHVEALDCAGRHLGVAFQIVDDILGLWGDPTTTGKSASADLRSGKKTYPLVVALDASNPAGSASKKLAQLLAAAPDAIDDGTVRKVGALVERAGGRTLALEEAQRQIEAFYSCAGQAISVTGPVEDLRSLLSFLLHRTA